MLIAEEVFRSAVAMWYSPDGQHLAFATFNDTVVKDMAYFYYGVPGAFENQYPTQVKLKYPKVRFYFERKRGTKRRRRISKSTIYCIQSFVFNYLSAIL